MPKCEECLNTLEYDYWTNDDGILFDVYYCNECDKHYKYKVD